MRSARGYRVLSDRQLVTLVTERDAMALMELHDRHAGALYALASAIVEDREEAAQAVLAVLLDLWERPGAAVRGADGPDASSGIDALLLRAVRLQAVELVRHGARRAAVPDPGGAGTPRRRPDRAHGDPRIPDPGDAGAPPRTSDPAAAELWSGATTSSASDPAPHTLLTAGTAMRQALGELSAERRRMLLLTYFGGYTQRELSALLSRPVAEIGAETAAALRELRRARQTFAQQATAERPSA